MRNLRTLFLALLALATPLTAGAETLRLAFDIVEEGAVTDPNGLWEPEEIEEARWEGQSPIRYATAPVDGGTLAISILIGEWCGMSHCPFRAAVTSDDGRVFSVPPAPDYGMICQSETYDDFVLDPVDLTITACDIVIDLKTGR